jgi:hypothetical protein
LLFDRGDSRFFDHPTRDGSCDELVASGLRRLQSQLIDIGNRNG